MASTNGHQEKRETARRFFVHSPADISQSYAHWAEKLQTFKGLDYGCILDKYVIPLHPGDLMAVVARPGHGKSSWMAYMAKRAAKDILKRKADDEVVVYVSWEQTVEEIEAFFQSDKEITSSDIAWGRADLKKLKTKALKRVHLPLWMFGESKRHEGYKRPRLTIDYVYESIEAMYDEFGKRPILMCLDYVQIMPIDTRGADRLTQVNEAVNDAKQLAVRMGLPIIMGVQARREVDGYRNPIPTMSDAQWSSSVEQIADKQIGIWRPIKTVDPAERPKIEVGGHHFVNDENLFVIKLLKQRFEKGYGVWAVHFEPQTLELHDYEIVSEGYRADVR